MNTNGNGAGPQFDAIVVGAGNIEQCGAPRHIYEEPATAFVVDFLEYEQGDPVSVHLPAAHVRILDPTAA